MGNRYLRNAEVGSSILLGSTNFHKTCNNIRRSEGASAVCKKLFFLLSPAWIFVGGKWQEAGVAPSEFNPIADVIVELGHFRF